MTAFVRNAAIGLVVATVAGAGTAATAEASLWQLLSGSTGQANPQQTQTPASGDPQNPAILAAGSVAKYADGEFTGKAYDAYYGNVQVKITITNGQIASVDVPQFPKDRRTSRYINSQALPVLKSEVISAQTTEVDTVSGATLTSEAFIRSLRTALKQAKPGA